MKFDLTKTKIAVIGLGYVGLPLAVEFGKLYKTIGFDVNKARIDELRQSNDKTLEVDKVRFAAAEHLAFTACLEDLSEANVYIVTVPTPVDSQKNPDMRPLIMASKAIGKVIDEGDIVIYESTVYPGATEEDCVPHIEKLSGLKYNKDFFAGYSPCLLYTSPSPRDLSTSRMPSSA